ncbi:hypothetical protein [Streptomyces griseus]|uniref:hypothetical protein n=1 Tax=Streptomyces griseus TaxID=1911 RepID=UPI00084074B5|nr:hypothetical protein [Streptomyces griseus]
MRRTGTTRRGALTTTGALALGAVLTGCGDGGDGGERRKPAGADARTASLRAQKALRAAAARASAALLTRYERAASAHPATAAGLAPLSAAVREHAAALGAPVRATTPAPVDPAAAPDARTALKELAAAERALADDRARALLEAEPELARLLASLAAAGAVHAYLLNELAEETPS